MVVISQQRLKMWRLGFLTTLIRVKVVASLKQENDSPAIEFQVLIAEKEYFTTDWDESEVAYMKFSTIQTLDELPKTSGRQLLKIDTRLIEALKIVFIFLFGTLEELNAATIEL